MSAERRPCVHFRVSAVVALVLAGVALLVVFADPALADNCDLRINPEDCQNTAWTIGAVAAIAAAITAILVALSGLGGASQGGPAEGGGVLVEEGAGEGAGGDAGEAGAGPPIFKQTKNDTCAIASIRMILQRVAGRVVSEQGLASRSAAMPNGYRQNADNFGTSTEGVVDFMKGLGLKASQQTLTIEQMQQALQEGKQVSVSHKVPGGNHRVVVTGIKTGPTGITFISVDDPATGTNRTYAASIWWPANGNPTRTVVVEPLKNVGR